MKSYIKYLLTKSYEHRIYCYKLESKKYVNLKGFVFCCKQHTHTRYLYIFN